MSLITKEDLLNEERLNDKLHSYKEELTQLRERQGKLVEQQAKLLQQKIEEFKPLMDFVRENRLYFNHPTLNVHSGLGAILDYDEEKNELYVFDVVENWIKRINLYNKEEKTLPEFIFVQSRNLQNAINGLNHLLTVQEKVSFQLNRDIKERETWIEENA